MVSQCTQGKISGSPSIPRHLPLWWPLCTQRKASTAGSSPGAQLEWWGSGGGRGVQLLLGNHLEKRCCSVVQSLNHLQIFVTPWTGALQASLSITNSQNLPKLISIKSVMSSNHLILCHFLLFLPSVFPSIRVFSSKLVLRIRWPKDWSFSFSISPSDEYSALSSFRTDWFDLLASRGTLKSFLQHYSSKVSILRCSAFFMVQLSHPYVTT